MNFTTPYMVDSVPSFCSLLEDHYSRPHKRNRPAHVWKLLPVVQSVWIKAYYRARASEAQNHRCCYCGVVMCDVPNKKNSITLEHVKPRSLGGLNHPANYAAACGRCNNNRGNTPLEIFLKDIGLTAEPILL